MAPFKALYGRSCRSPLFWAEIRNGKLLGPEIIRETIEKIAIITEKIKVAEDKYKSYADQHCKDKEFSVGDHVLLKVSLIQGVVRFNQRRGKLSPRYIRPFEILKHVGRVAYRLTLPPR